MELSTRVVFIHSFIPHRSFKAALTKPVFAGFYMKIKGIRSLPPPHVPSVSLGSSSDGNEGLYWRSGLQPQLRVGQCAT